ncbi:MAG: response regulator [Methylobacterium mesophilicum]|nr:response regulator [Methylobacterium mesophilicum]
MSKRVLIVEDELLVAMDIQDSLEAIGLVALGPCASIREAMAALDDARPDCAILDVQLLDGEVFGVADRLASHDVPIIFHSGHADQNALALRYPSARICSKPCAPSVLEREVLRAVERHEPAERPVAMRAQA